MVDKPTPEEIRARQSKTGRSNVNRAKSHERKVASLLTEWTGSEFRRRRVEGRDSTVIERESTADVISVKDEINFSIEAKCGAMPSFDALLANPNGTIFSEWWHQTCFDVSLLTKVFKRTFYPMMFFRPSLNANWIAISEYAFSRKVLKPIKDIGDDRGIWFPHFSFDEYKHSGPVSYNVIRTKNKANYKFVPIELDPIIFCRWSDFAANVDPKSFFFNKDNIE